MRRWSSTFVPRRCLRDRQEVLPDDVPWRCMTRRNLTMTLDEGRIRTWRLPAFSALLMLFRASCRTEVRTILALVGRSGRDSQFVKRKRGI